MDSILFLIGVFWGDFLDHMQSDDGVGVIEVILILVVLIALIIIFQSNLKELMGNIFGDIKSKASSVFAG